MRGLKTILFFILCFSLNYANHSQQTASTIEPPRSADVSFHYDIKEPAYSSGQGPIVFVDEAHNNFHTAFGTYLPFARLLEQDGYVIQRARSKITNESLKLCKIFVISDAQPSDKPDDPPTFSQEEIDTLSAWVRQGGSLLLITDHMPDPSAIEGLASSFGIEIKNGYVLNNHYSIQETPMLFQRKNGGLSNHPITEGRNSSERVQTVATFTGTAFKTDQNFQPIMTIRADKKLWMPEKLYEFNRNTPYISVKGWYQGAVTEVGSGRIAIFSEAAMFTAQIFDQGKIRVGMNHPIAKDNAQLLLNVIHWLSGLI